MSALEDLYNLATEWTKYFNPATHNDSDLAGSFMTFVTNSFEDSKDDPTAYLRLFGLDDPDQRAQFEYLFGAGIPFLSDFIKMRDSYNFMNDYLKNVDLNWSDIRYMSRTTGYGSGADLLNWTSRNLENFYKTEERGRKAMIRKYGRLFM